MALQAWIAVKGSKQGQFKSETIAAKRRDKWMPVLAFTMGVTSPHDPASGQISGKRQHQPVTIVKAWGAASPQGLIAIAANEVLTEVDLEFTRASTIGEEVVYQTVKLSNASFSQIARFTDPADGTANTSSGPAVATDMLELERWSFTFQKIEVTDNDGKTTFDDSWSATT